MSGLPPASVGLRPSQQQTPEPLGGTGAKSDRAASFATSYAHHLPHPLPLPGPANVLDTGLREIVERIVDLRQAGSEPAARAPTSEPLDDIDTLIDPAELIVDFVHRHLLIAVGVELPAGIYRAMNHLRVGLTGARIERDRW
jgi:hypothetical protein